MGQIQGHESIALKCGRDGYPCPLEQSYMVMHMKASHGLKGDLGDGEVRFQVVKGESGYARDGMMKCAQVHGTPLSPAIDYEPHQQSLHRLLLTLRCAKVKIDDHLK